MLASFLLRYKSKTIYFKELWIRNSSSAPIHAQLHECSFHCC